MPLCLSAVDDPPSSPPTSRYMACGHAMDGCITGSCITGGCTTGNRNYTRVMRPPSSGTRRFRFGSLPESTSTSPHLKNTKSKGDAHLENLQFRSAFSEEAGSRAQVGELDMHLSVGACGPHIMLSPLAEINWRHG